MLHESDPTTLGEDDIYSVVSDTSLGDTVTTANHTDTQQDHTYDAAEFHTQTNSVNEHPQYNTLQRENTANAHTISNSTFDAYNKIDITSKDVQKCSKLSMQVQRSTRRTDSKHEYDDVDTGHTQRENQPYNCDNETDWKYQAVPLDYEPVYYGPNSTKVEESTGEHELFDDEMYGTHKPVSKRTSVQQGKESMSKNIYSETTTTVKSQSEHMSTANQEVEYAQPIPPNTTRHTQDAQAKDEHFYHSLEDSEPTKAEEYNREQGKEVVEFTSQNIYSETTTTVKSRSEHMSTANQEVEYAEPLPPNTKRHTQDAQAKDEHFYHSLENKPTEAEECNNGVPYSIGSSNPETSVSNNQYTSSELAALPTRNNVTADIECQTQPLTSLSDRIQTMDEVGTINAPILFNIDQCEFDDPMYECVPHSVPKPSSMSSDLIHEKIQTVQHVFNLSQEEVPCRDMNEDPELLNHEKDIESYANAPEYSDPVVSECVDDDMAND